MTSTLARQLEHLQVAASAQLGIERPHVSLLFDRKEAATLYKEDVLKIVEEVKAEKMNTTEDFLAVAIRSGRSGLSQLRKVDATVISEEDEEELFSDKALTLQRALLTVGENKKLDKVLERVLAQISPYLLQFATQQILEWLIYRFQIHLFNAPKMFVTFLPFHNTKIFARLLSLLDLRGIEYDWVREYAKAEVPIPFERLLTGEEYAEKKFSHFFTLYAKLGVYLVHDSTKINDALVSKILPSVAINLKSKVVSLRLSSLIITTQLCASVPLTETVLNSLLKLILLRINAATMCASINTVVLICQRQNIKTLPLKGIKKLIRKEEELKTIPYIVSLVNRTDLTKFLVVVWNTVIPVFFGDESNIEDEFMKKLCDFIIGVCDNELLDSETAALFFSMLFENLSTRTVSRVFPEMFCKHVHSLMQRFGAEFDSILDEWKIRDGNVTEMFSSCICKVNLYDMNDSLNSVRSNSERKRRRRTSSCRKSLSEEGTDDRKRRLPKRVDLKEVQTSQIETLHGPLPEEFHGNPLEKFFKLVSKQNWKEACLGLEKLSNKKFIERYSALDFEDFIAGCVEIVTKDSLPVKSNIRDALSKLPITSEFACTLLKRTTEQPPEKRLRSHQSGQQQKAYFINENESDYYKRLVFVIELLNASDSVTTSAKLIAAVFALLKCVTEYEEDENNNERYLQRLIISLLVKIIRRPVNYVVKKSDLQMDYIVEVVRNTQDQRTLRDCLRLLTAAVKISPVDVLSQIMSVFTFMGSGLLKKDNDLTLGIIEEALSVFFSAIVTDDNNLFHERLVSVARIFAASVADIPVHRRIRILRAVANAATVKHLWVVIAVLFEQYCVTWQRNIVLKGRTNIEQFEEMATEMVSLYNGAEQLLCAVNLVEYIVYMGDDIVSDVESLEELPQDRQLYKWLFDRAKHSVQKLRHYRFAIIGWVARLLSSRDLFDKLSENNDEEMYNDLLIIGKRMLICSMELDEFVTKQSIKNDAAESNIDVGTVKYWMAVTSRADIVAEKFRNLLPVSVSGRLVAEILSDKDVTSKMRDKALQLLNVKLMQDGVFHKDGGIEAKHMILFAEKLLTWIRLTESKEEVILCQNAAFTMRLLARRMNTERCNEVLSECVEACCGILKTWRSMDEALIGNILLLLAEIIKSHNMRATLLASDMAVPICLEVINQQLETSLATKAIDLEDGPATQEIESRSARRKRVAQQSMSGRRIGGDTLLICALACLQRTLDQFAHYVSAHFVSLLTTISRLSAHYDPLFEIIGVSDKNQLNKTYSIQNRIYQIRKAMIKVELRVLVAPFQESCKLLLNDPKALVYLFSLYAASLETKDRSIIVRVLTAFSSFALTAFCLRSKNCDATCYETTSDCERRMINAFISVTEQLSENELRPLMVDLFKWMKPGIEMNGSSNNKGHEERSYIVTSFNLINSLYDTYNTLVLPHFGRFFEVVPQVMLKMNGSKTDPDALLFFGKKGTFESLEGNTLITLLIDFVGKCAKHQEFFTDERAKLVLESMVDELDNLKVSGHEERCSLHLSDCLYNMADTLNDIMSEMFAKIMLKTRRTSWKIRYRILLVLERMFSRMGEAVAPILPSVLPFLSELSEDENKKVEEQCDKVLNIIRSNFGEEIADSIV